MATTIVAARINSIFGAMFDKKLNLHFDAAVTKNIIDKNPYYFGFIGTYSEHESFISIRRQIKSCSM